MQTPLSIRPGAPADAETLVRFNLRMALETENRRLDPEVAAAGVAAVLNDASRGFYLVAECEGGTIGGLMVTPEWSDWRNAFFWWIQSVYIVPEQRRRGVLRALVQDVRERARQTGRVCGIRLYVERDNAVAQAAYACLGLRETHYRMSEDSLPANDP